MIVQSEHPNATSILQDEATRLGLDALGIVPLNSDARMRERLQYFLDESRHGSMTWLAANADRRGDPLKLWPEARSAIMIGQSYAPGFNPLAALDERSNGIISVYAQGADYHNVLKSKIKALARTFAASTGSDVKVFVDTAPLMEKPLAAKAGLGWQGKHTNLVSRTHGSWLFLGAILTTAQLDADTPEDDHCGSCHRCLDICPTSAFPAPYQLDARRCLAYLSIEHRGHIAPEFRKPMGNRVFGCDDCLAVCPWNKFASAAREARFGAREGTGNPPLVELLELDDAAFRGRFAGTPVKRTGRDRVVRNALIAAGNSQDRSLIPVVTALLRDASSLVRAMAVWALNELADQEQVVKLMSIVAPLERDADVLSEWRAAAASGAS